MGINDTSADAAVDLKKSARRRLVGAIALALLAVIVLPLVMEHEPKPSAQDIQVRIPSQDAVEPAPLATTPALAKSPEAASGQSVAPDKVPPAVAPAVATAPAGRATAVAVLPVAAATAPEKKSADNEPGAAAAASANAEAARAAAVLNGETDQYLLRLGAYQNAGNVRLLLAKVKEMGLPVYAEKFESANGPRTRVVAGPFASRESAEKAQAKVKRIGVDGAVIPKQ